MSGEVNMGAAGRPSAARIHLAHDWYDGGIPENVELGENVYIDTSYSFAAFRSTAARGLLLGECAGVYDRTAFVTGPGARIRVGPFTCLNAVTLVCNDRITIGAHCLLAWGSVLADTWPDSASPPVARRASLEAAATRPDRWLAPVSAPRPVTLEDNVWVGFDSVILPGVTLGQGCIIGCKTVITENVPPYTVVVGMPPRTVRTLAGDDPAEVREKLLRELRRA